MRALQRQSNELSGMDEMEDHEENVASKMKEHLKVQVGAQIDTKSLKAELSMSMMNHLDGKMLVDRLSDEAFEVRNLILRHFLD